MLRYILAALAALVLLTASLIPDDADARGRGRWRLSGRRRRLPRRRCRSSRTSGRRCRSARRASSRRLSGLRLSGRLSRLRVSGLRCRCGGGRRRCGRRGCGGGLLPRRLRLRRLRQLDLPERLLIRIEAVTTNRSRAASNRRLCLAAKGYRDRAYRGGRCHHWINGKNRRHPASSRAL